MTSRERFIACIERSHPDRPPITPLYAPVFVLENLMRYLGVNSVDEFRALAGEDFRYVSPEYIGPELMTFEDGGYESEWGTQYRRVDFPGGHYFDATVRPFAKVNTLEEAKRLRLPSPDWYDYKSVGRAMAAHPDKVLIAGSMGHMDFLNGVAFMLGVERVLTGVIDGDPVYMYLVEKRFEFFMEQVERTLKEGGGRIDVVKCGEDLGTQLAPIINPATFERLHAPKYAAYFALAHKYGAKTMMHSCGAVRKFIPILIDAGLDILDVVHVDAVGMNLQSLHDEFHDKLTFSGTLSVQTLLNHGTPEQVAQAVEERKRLFATGGIIIGPSNLMQIDMPPENFVAMCQAIGCMEPFAFSRDAL